MLMKAITCRRFRPFGALELREVERPSPRDNEVLVRVHASSVNFADTFMVHLAGWGVSSLEIPGSDMAGRVEAVGQDVRQFRPGDEVFAQLGVGNSGAYAEYVAVAEDTIALKPANVSFEQAAAVPMAGLTALQGLRDKGQIQSGQKVLIQGASGGIGTFAVQIAKALGAEVTAVCSAKNLELVRSLGADHTIDYTKEDFTRNRQQYDLIFGIRGYHSIFAYRRALSRQGTYVMAGGSFFQIVQAFALGPRISEAGGKKLRSVAMQKSQKDLVFLKELIEAGKIKPVIDRRYPLSDVPEAFRYHAKGHTRGKVVITV